MSHNIIGTNVRNMFHKEWAKNVALRVFTISEKMKIRLLPTEKVLEGMAISKETAPAAQTGIVDYFDTTYVSCGFRPRRPNRVFTRHIAVALGIDPRNDAESVLTTRTFAE
ncbi:hypothetical protein DPMN_003343 [Dreissena polymorpha]|uniref:Uncharacterized protein n=1 Tax=Dreissena polymorpha TaxID=45954 RepID=A0A9D4MLD8_DREPO|nr:hypothetical protein DPMN_003343 [Dreissena polymorpha]